MNPKLSKAEREKRGTYRGDRDYETRDARDPEEKKPRRPAALEGHSAAFWYRHVDQVWESGWLRRDNVDFFVLVCEMWGEMLDLKDWFDDDDINGEPRGRCTFEKGQFVVKEVERPQSKLYEKLRESVYKKAASIGIILDKPKPPSKKKPKDDKKPIGEFEIVRPVK